MPVNMVALKAALQKKLKFLAKISFHMMRGKVLLHFWKVGNLNLLGINEGGRMVKSSAINNQALFVDLSTRDIQRIPISASIRSKYLGGKGMALKLLHDFIQPGVDPLSPENILIFASGATAGTASPAGGRFVVVSKSPLTGIYASSYAGGRFGLSLKKAGYDALIITGTSEKPSYIQIEDESISICNAQDLWGMDTYAFQEQQKSLGDWVVIGPAGENRVRYALIASDKRVAGRCGLGAVMGSKNLKGIVARGSKKFQPQSPEPFKKALKTAQAKMKAHDNTGRRLRILGTSQNVNIFGTTGIMPVRNFSRSRFEQMKNIDAETIRNHHYQKNHGCVGCPIKCGRIGTFQQKKLVSPEYETIAMMGSNLMIHDISQIAMFNDQLNRLGLDSISTGNVIGFVMELTEKGLLETNLSFGSIENISQAINDIAYRKNFGDEMAEGVMRLSEKYGGNEYAIHVKGLEMPGYDPRGCKGQGLGYATAVNGANHLSGGTHAIEAESYLDPLSPHGKAYYVKFMQDVNEAVNSSIFCIQTQYPFLEENPIYKYTPMPIMRLIMRYLPFIAVKTADFSDYSALLSSLLGEPISGNDFYTAGERVFNLERHMNCLEGISRMNDTLPQRILKEKRDDQWPSIELEPMLDQYYDLRGWSKEGIPEVQTMKRLDI
jgi:aldehyde:ferredoxin oxidoreductase